MTGSRLQMRAAAMRCADILSRVDPNTLKTKTNDGKYKGRDLFVPSALKCWPDIDVDFLLPENAGELINVDDGKTPAVWPVSYAVAFRKGDLLQISMIKSLDLKSVRGIARRYGAFNVELSTIYVDGSSNIVDFGGGPFMRIGRNWSNMTTGGNFVAGCTGEATSIGPSVAIGCSLKTRYEWSAVFSFPSGIRLRFGTSASGALSLFRDREGPVEGRRLALLHWVRRHWRVARDEQELREVRRHLRGVTNIDWRGMQVSVIPSEYELEQVA